MNQRIDWKHYALNLAATASMRSEDPYAKVGACALGFDNRVLGVAYNGLKSGKNVDFEFWKDRDLRRPFMIHAEQNLLSLFERNKAKIIAVTLLPCASCARLICSWNIPEVVYRDDYKLNENSLEIFKFYNVNVMQIS